MKKDYFTYIFFSIFIITCVVWLAATSPTH